MSKLPVISGQNALKHLPKLVLLCSTTWKPYCPGARRTSSNEEPQAMVTVPNHREIDRGTLRSIIRQAGLTVDALINLL